MAARQGIFDGILTKLGIFDRAEDPAGIFGEDYVPAPTSTATMVDEEEWWGGAQLCFARIGLAAAVALAASNAATAASLQIQTEEPAGSLFGQAEEYYWQNPVAPVPATLQWPQPWTFDVQEPAGALRGQPDEDFWRNSVAPVPATLLWPKPWSFEQHDPDSLRGQPDEDFWKNPVAPVVATLAYPQPWVGDTQDPAGSLFGQADEDLWWVPQPFTPPPIVRPFSDTDEVVPQAAAFQPDEDSWVNAVGPVQATLAWPQPWTFDVQEPAGALYGVPEEDAYRPPQTTILWLARPYSDTDEVVPQPATGTPDEDFWTSGVAPVPSSLQWPQPWGFEQHEQAVLYGVPDELYWVSGVAAVWGYPAGPALALLAAAGQGEEWVPAPVTTYYFMLVN